MVTALSTGEEKTQKKVESVSGERGEGGLRTCMCTGFSLCGRRVCGLFADGDVGVVVRA